MDWNKYRRKGLTEARDPAPEEDFHGISVSAGDWTEILRAKEEGKPAPGKIARNPKNHEDKWYVAAEYFAEHFEEVEDS